MYVQQFTNVGSYTCDTIVLKIRPQGEILKKNYLKLFREADAVDVSTAFVNTINVKRRANWVGQSY